LSKQAFHNALSDEEMAAVNMSRSGGGPAALGRWLVRLLGIGALTLAGAYYVPLYRAHRELTTDFAALSQEHDTDAKSVADLKAQLATATATRDALQSKTGKADARATAAHAGAEQLRATLTTKLAGPASHGALAISSKDDHALVTFPAAALREADGVEVTPAASASLCDVARSVAASGATIRVVDYVAPDVAPSAQDSAWVRASERGANVAHTLEGPCRFPASHLAAIALNRSGADVTLSPPAFELEIAPPLSP